MLEYVEINTGDKLHTTVIWLHGLGADGYDFAPAIDALALPDDSGLRFVLPHAPVQAVTINQGMQMRAWYDIRHETIDMGADLTGMRASTDQVMQLVLTEQNQGHKILLAGFSQGGVIALMTALEMSKDPSEDATPAPVGVMALSTYLMDETLPDSVNSHYPVMIMHGTEDSIVPSHLAHRSVAQMQSLGFEPELKLYPMAHSLCPQQLQDIRNWLLETTRT